MKAPEISAAEYLKSIELKDKPGLFKKGTATTAAYIAFDSRPREEGGPDRKLHVRIMVSCTGFWIPTGITLEGSSVHALSCPGAEWAFPHWACTSHQGWHFAPGMLIDTRSLKQLKDGCCPISIITEQLGGEEATD